MIATQSGVELDFLNYHRRSKTYRAGYDQEATAASMAVVAALSEVMDSDPTELEPLHRSIDTEALDEIVRVRGTQNGDNSVSFRVEGYEITVYSYGVVAVSSSGQGREDDQATGIGHL